MKKWLKKSLKVSAAICMAYLALLIMIFFASLVGGYNSAKNQNNPKSQNASSADPLNASALYNDIEKERQLNNIPALSHNPLLDKSAQQKCDDMVAGQYYAHPNPKTGKQGNTYIFDNIPSATYGGEILNQGGVTTAQEFMDSWMNSPEHKADIIDPKFTDVGFAVCVEDSQNTVVGHLAVIPQATVPPASPQAISNPQSCITTYSASPAPTVPGIARTTCN